jgi:hypothetical protein
MDYTRSSWAPGFSFLLTYLAPVPGINPKNSMLHFPPISFSILIATLALLFFSSCNNNNEIGHAGDVSPEAIYFDYRISGDEGNPNATVLLQYRFGGENGTTLTIDEPGKVELDNTTLKADSTKITGAYYEWQKPVKEFAGRHTIRFTGYNGKKYEEEFIFQPFTLCCGLPDTLKTDSALLEIKGLNNGDILNLIMTDTVFGSNGVERRVKMSDGKITITPDDIQSLAPGPIHLELELEKRQPVKNGTAEGGRIVVVYTVRREFWLKN